VDAPLYILIPVSGRLITLLPFWCRIDVIDEAVLRPGRFGKKHFVPLPGANERAAILKAHASKKPVSEDVDLGALARREECNNLTGADLASLVSFVIFLEGVFQFVGRCITARLCFGLFFTSERSSVFNGTNLFEHVFSR
jgi:hypothetical protein